MKFGLTEVKILKSGIKVVNPFTPDFPAAGRHLIVYAALNNVFTEAGYVFAGKVDEMVALGIEAGINERDLRGGFEDLVEYGFITIDDGVFTPTELYLRYFLP